LINYPAELRNFKKIDSSRTHNLDYALKSLGTSPNALAKPHPQIYRYPDRLYG
jgi:hypothetical protein